VKAPLPPSLIGALALCGALSCKEPAPPPATLPTDEEIAAMEAGFEFYEKDLKAGGDGGGIAIGYDSDPNADPQSPPGKPRQMSETESAAEVARILAVPPPGNRPPVSFTRQVVPILVAKCGECHIKKTRGDLSFSSYDTLMTGTPDGPVVVAGRPEESPLIAMIQSGKMPQEKDALDPKDIETLRTWVARGAVFDGSDPAQLMIEFLPSKAEEPASESAASESGTTQED